MRQRLVLVLILLFFAVPCWAASLEVDNIFVATQAENAVKARDQAINKAQRQAFGALVGKSDADIARITDAQIARLVRGFSVQGEKLTSRNYRAFFTIRFMNGATNNLILSNGFQLVPSAAGGQPIVFDNNAAAAALAATAAAATGVPAAPAVTADGKPVEATPNAAAAIPTQTQSIVVLPILDIGSRRVVWDDPNPWRSIWQESDHSTPNIKVSIPLGDVDDIADVADASFLNGGKANVAHMLERYSAGNLYVVIAKNMGAALDTSGGMAISLYRHNGQELKFIRKMIIHPRPGFLFNDAVPAAMTMISVANGGDTSSTTINKDVLGSSDNNSELPPVSSTPTPAAVVPMASQSISGSVTVTVPYQSLQQWVSIQKRLRLVPGIKATVPLRVSSSSAQVKLLTTTATTDDLSHNLSIQHFILQKMATGEMALIEQ